MTNFASPQFFWLLLILPLYLYYVLYRQKNVTFAYTNFRFLKLAGFKNQKYLDYIFIFLRLLILLILIIALARPLARTTPKNIEREGVDIIIVLDSSGSMAAEDLKDNRLISAKNIVSDFIRKRSDDRIGLVVFGLSAATRVPLTYDREMLLRLIQQVQLGQLGDGTAIGEALAVGLNRIKKSAAKSKVIILVTDGENNAGTIGPLESAELAKAIGVKIYTIGIGTAEGAPLIINDPVYGKQYARNPDGSVALTKLNINDLVKIAEITGGSFFQAKTTSELSEIFGEIDRLEKTKQIGKINYNYRELFPFYLQLALFLILLEILLQHLIWRRRRCHN